VETVILVTDTNYFGRDSDNDFNIVLERWIAKYQAITPSTHINNIVVKAHQRVNATRRYFVSRDINLLVRAFLVYVRLIQEYKLRCGYLIVSVILKPLTAFWDVSPSGFQVLGSMAIANDCDFCNCLALSFDAILSDFL